MTKLVRCAKNKLVVYYKNGGLLQLVYAYYNKFSTTCQGSVLEVV
jgi:hypothetical protein